MDRRRALLACALLAPALGARGAPAASPGERVDGLPQRIAGWLLRPDARGVLEPMRWERPPALLAIFFGAHTCGPCRAFTPTLVGVRNALRAAGADTEVVYAALDDRAADIRRTALDTGMPWPALDVRRAGIDPAMRRLAGLATPNLVLVDSGGAVLASAWEGRRYPGLEPVLRRWHAWAAARAKQ